MANVLFLVHRLPYPPNKGDKVRSYHMLQHLSKRHRVFLGTFVDDPDDERHLPAVRELCEDLHAPRLHALPARIRSLGGLARREPLTLGYYRNRSLTAWAARVRKDQAVDCTLVFSSSMAQYTAAAGGPLLVDFVDVDSAKWTDYATSHRWPLSWLYRREGSALLQYERRLALRADHSFFATDKEAALFRRLAPECDSRVGSLANGVDAEYFSPRPGVASPFADGEHALVFTGAMDYWPNIDAVCWFARDVLPRLRQTWPRLRFHIVGRSPSPAVRALAGEAVSVTGTVADVRPYLQHATVVVAPLRLARGIQNKVLEAMAMARPVVAAATCIEAIDATAGVHVLAAASADDYVRAVSELLLAPERAAAMGHAGREQVVSAYGWDARLAELDRLMAVVAAPRQAA